MRATGKRNLELNKIKCWRIFFLFRECCKAVRLLIFSTILQASYDEEKRVFLSPNKLPTKSLDFIRRELENIISRSSEQKNNVKLKSLGFFTVAKKSEVQDLLDSILKIAYPYISQARGLTDMNKKLKYPWEYPKTGLKFSLLPEALPEGYEDKTPVIIGFKKDESGKKSVVKVHVWKEGTHVLYKNNVLLFYKPIISESAPVDMEDAECGHPGPFTLSVTGRAGQEFSQFLGQGIYGVYNLTEWKRNNRPVYRNRGGYHLYSLRGGMVWVVSYRTGDKWPAIKSAKPVITPALCQSWEYRYYDDGDYKYKPGDITITWSK